MKCKYKKGSCENCGYDLTQSYKKRWNCCPNCGLGIIYTKHREIERIRRYKEGPPSILLRAIWLGKRAWGAILVSILGIWLFWTSVTYISWGNFYVIGVFYLGTIAIALGVFGLTKHENSILCIIGFVMGIICYDQYYIHFLIFE